MAGAWERARILITVKTYPELSTKYRETSCVAGIRLDRGALEHVRLLMGTIRAPEWNPPTPLRARIAAAS
ncbi:hypothetical protein GCM10009837_42470 [Streptomyces durmitorensis]